MATVTEITKSGSLYGFNVVPSGDYIDVHLVRESNGDVYVSMSVDGLKPAPQNIDNPFYWNASSLFRVKNTKGKTVTIESDSVIKSCKVMDEDGTVTDVALDDDLRLLGEDGTELLTEDGYSLCLDGK